MSDTIDVYGPLSGEKKRVSVNIPERLHDEIERQVERGVVESTSEWFTSAAVARHSLLSLSSTANIPDEAGYDVMMPTFNGEESRMTNHRQSIYLPIEFVGVAKAFVEAGESDSMAEYWRETAELYIGIQVLASRAGANTPVGMDVEAGRTPMPTEWQECDDER